MTEKNYDNYPPPYDTADKQAYVVTDDTGTYIELVWAPLGEEPTLEQIDAALEPFNRMKLAALFIGPALPEHIRRAMNGTPMRRQ